MGLDSVELLVRFEKYFEINVPDAVAETLATPANVAAWLSQQLGLADNIVSPGREAVVQQLQMLFATHLPDAQTELADLLPTGEAWARQAQQLADQVGWQLPEIGWLQPPRAWGWLNELFNWVAVRDATKP